MTSVDPSLRSILTRAGNLVFPSNRASLTTADAGSIRVVRLASGHVIAYGPHGRRILAADPAGHPLHECEWSRSTDGVVRMVHARMRLDWDQWVGIKPRGLVNAITLDLAKKPDWQRLSTDDLRVLASRGLGVPFDEVKFFYPDEDLMINAQGLATIRQAKDALYVLDRATFDADPEHVRFMACMGAMHWADIDFLPVVELFQSLLPGTGSAAFELIRGLYDDQNQDRAPRPLRYRGIPPYPSEGAYKLFSAFFVAKEPAGSDPFAVFMDPGRSHEVTWLPVVEPPWRFFDEEPRLCVTIQGGSIRKATLADDPAGLSFLYVGPKGFAPCNRTVAAVGGRLLLNDGERRQIFPLRPEWTVRIESHVPPGTIPGPDWRALFDDAEPHVESREAYGAVLLYPDDETPVPETSTQPLVADYLEDYLESTPEFAATLARSQRVLIDGFDAALTACISLDRPRDYRVLYTRPAFAQRQAQTLWNRLAKTGRLNWLSRIRFMQEEQGRDAAYRDRYDLAYVWVSFQRWHEASELTLLAQRVATALLPGSPVFLVGPIELESVVKRAGLTLTGIHDVDRLPTVEMHRSILPRARVQARLTLFELRRS